MGTATKIKKKYRYTFYNKDVILQSSSVYFDSIQKHLKISVMLLFFIQTSWVMEYWLPLKPKKKKKKKKKKNLDFKSGRRLNEMSYICYFVSTKLFLC